MEVLRCCGFCAKFFSLQNILNIIIVAVLDSEGQTIMDFFGPKSRFNWNCTLFAQQLELRSCLVAVKALKH